MSVGKRVHKEGVAYLEDILASPCGRFYSTELWYEMDTPLNTLQGNNSGNPLPFGSASSTYTIHVMIDLGVGLEATEPLEIYKMSWCRRIILEDRLVCPL